MNEQIDYATQVLTQLIEILSGALPGIFAGLVVIVVFLIAGVLILFYQPFGYGDKITVSGNRGTVIGINFRYTVLEADGGAVIHVPNSTMFSNSVTVEAGTGDVL